jgi:hypothetical protein
VLDVSRRVENDLPGLQARLQARRASKCEPEELAGLLARRAYRPEATDWVSHFRPNALLCISFDLATQSALRQRWGDDVVALDENEDE